jgi:ATP-dependent RNA helicase DDX56/DBP9
MILQQVRAQQPRLGNIEGDNVLAAIGSIGSDAMSEEDRMQPAPLVFNFSELDNFRYRVDDTLRSITSAAVKELRAAEIKREILNSTKLKTYFAENPNDLKVLRHDKAIAHPIIPKDHLKYIPEYLIPASMRGVVSTNNAGGRRSKKRKTISHGVHTCI